MVVGDRRAYLIALLTLDGSRIPEVAAGIGSAASSADEAMRCKRFARYLGEQIERLNGSLAKNETVKKFALVPEFSIDGGELTPTMKLKRRIVHQKHGDLIESLYGEAVAESPKGGPVAAS